MELLHSATKSGLELSLQPADFSTTLQSHNLSYVLSSFDWVALQSHNSLLGPRS